MKYTIIGLLFVSLNAFAFEPAPNDSSVQVNCLKSTKKQHLPYARSKNFPQSKSNVNYYNCLDKSKKLIIFSRGLTLFLSDDVDLKLKFATELASIYGKRVLLETIPSLNNEILCASYTWWINNSFCIKSPEQIIIPLLPIPSIKEPINKLTVSHNRNLSKDWFREFLLPEAIQKLERSISPLRKNAGKLIILDGRANKRKWGRFILQSIQPSKQINYMLPYD